MNDLYFDNKFLVEKDFYGNINIDRLYMLDTTRFDAYTWMLLSNIYESLPQQIVLNNVKQPMWYGDESDCYYLKATIKNKGLHLFGYLKYEDWIEWENVFHKNIHILPTKKYYAYF